MGFSIDGLGSGLDTTTIVQQLMQIERVPQDRLRTSKIQASGRGVAWAAIELAMNKLKSAAEALSTPGKFETYLASSSNTASLTATAGTGATAGSYTIGVKSLATAQRSTASGFTSASQTVGAGAVYITQNLAALGASAVKADATVADGNHTVTVTQASAGAAATGAAVGTISMNGSNNTLNISVNGVTREVTLANTTYTAATAASALQTALDTAFGSNVVTVGTSGSALTFATAVEGSAATISFGTASNGKDAKAALGLTTPTVVAGRDARFTIDGAAFEAKSITDGQPVTLVKAGTATPSGWTFTSTAGHFTTGTATIGVTHTTATTTVGQLASAITAAGGPATANAITTTSTALVLTGKSTGTAGAFQVSTDPTVSLGTFTVEAGTQAHLTVNGADVYRDTNTISDVVNGVTLTLVKADADLNLNVKKDTDGIASNAKALVDALNGLFTAISAQTKYDLTAKRVSPLTGDSGARSLSSSAYRIVGEALGTGVTKTLGQLGITVNRDGSYAYDDTKYKAALAADPGGVASLVSSVSAKLRDFAVNETTETTTNGITRRGIVLVGKEGADRDQRDIQKRVDEWDERLKLRETNLRRQFSALESAMNQLKNQGSWMSGQLASLPKWSSD